MSAALDGFAAGHVPAIEAARRRIAGHVRRTPLLTTDLDPELRIKPELLQVTGSFKPRGAFNAVLGLVERTPDTRGVIAVSSGNHAQAVALAARTAGIRAVIIIPEDSNPLKIAATRALGAEVITEGVTFTNRDARLAREMEARGLTLVHPYDDLNIIHGAASAAVEMLEDDPDLEVIVTPVGGGGLISGTALAAAALRPGLRVIGVEPEGADDAARSLARGVRQRLDSAPATIADGVRTLSIGATNFEVIVSRGLVHAIVTVSEEEIEEAVRLAWTRLHLAVEPTGALPLAAWMSGRFPHDGRIGLILSGGNADLELVARLLRR